VTLRLVVLAMLIMDSTGFDVTRVLASRPSIPRRLTVNISSRPSRRLLAAPGWVLSSRLARCLALRRPRSGSGWLKAFTSFASTHSFSLSGQAELVKAQQDQQHWVHPLIQDLLEKLSVDLRESHELAARFDDRITALLHDAGLSKWLEELVSEGLAAGSRDLQDPHGIFVGEVSSYLRSLAQRTLDDPAFRGRLDAGLQRAVEQVLAENRNAFTDLVQHVIAGLEGSVVARQVELAAGRDLQFIRINGTVGALARVGDPYRRRRARLAPH